MKIRYATIIVNDMEESVKFYTETLDFTLDEVFDVPGGKITLLNGDGFAGIELIEHPSYEVGIYSIGMDVEDINDEIKKLEDKGANIALKPMNTSGLSLKCKNTMTSFKSLMNCTIGCTIFFN